MQAQDPIAAVGEVQVVSDQQQGGPGAGCELEEQIGSETQELRGILQEQSEELSGMIQDTHEQLSKDLTAETRTLADNLRHKLGSGVVVLGRADGDKAALLVAVTEDLKSRIPAGKLVRELARIIGGGGGGRPEMAEAGGRDPSKLDEALAASLAQIEALVEQDG